MLNFPAEFTAEHNQFFNIYSTVPAPRKLHLTVFFQVIIYSCKCRNIIVCPNKQFSVFGSNAIRIPFPAYYCNGNILFKIRQIPFQKAVYNTIYISSLHIS